MNAVRAFLALTTLPFTLALAACANSGTMSEDTCEEIAAARSQCEAPEDVTATLGAQTLAFAVIVGDDVIQDCREPSCLEVPFEIKVMDAAGAPATADEVERLYRESDAPFADAEGIFVVDHSEDQIYCLRHQTGPIACAFVPNDLERHYFQLVGEGGTTLHVFDGDGQPTNAVVTTVFAE